MGAPPALSSPSSAHDSSFSADSISLMKFEVKSKLLTTNNTAFPAGIFLAQTGGYSILLDYCVNIFFPEQMFSDFLDPVRFVPPVNWPLLAQRGQIELADIRSSVQWNHGEEAIIRTLRDLCSTGYVCGYLDEYFLENTRAYRRCHNKHETLIVDVDDFAENFDIAVYNSDDRFIIQSVPANLLVQSIVSTDGWPVAYTYNSRDLAPGYCKGMRKPLYHIRSRVPITPLINLQTFREQIRDYCESTARYISYLGDPLTNWTENGGEYGLGYYRSLTRFVSSMGVSQMPIDPRTTKLIYEQKAVMIERFKVIEKQGLIFPDSITASLRQLTQETLLLHTNVVAMNRGLIARDYPSVIEAIETISANDREWSTTMLKFLDEGGI